MHETNLKRSGALLVAAMVAIIGCQGSQGAQGAQGPSGPAGATGPSGTNGAPGAPGPSSVTTGLNLTITNVTVANNAVSVRFVMKDDRTAPIDWNGVYSINTPLSVRFALANVTTDASNNVLAYNVLTNSGTPAQPTAFSPGTPAAPSNPAANGTIVENGSGAGDYTYTFPASAAIDTTSPGKGDLTHTVWIQATRQTDLNDTTDPQTFKAVNVKYDWIPSGKGTPINRQIVLTANCSKCHDQFKPEGAVGNAFHGGGRVEAPFCNICHNPGRVSNPAANSLVFVHRIHYAENLSNQANLFHGISVTYPQDARNCAACHNGAAQGTQADSRPTIAACTSCHDYVDFTGAQANLCTDPVTTDPVSGLPLPCGHMGGPQLADSSTCAGCHGPAGNGSGGYSHPIPVEGYDKGSLWDVVGGNANTNAANVAAQGAIPPGAIAFKYVVKSVAAVADTSVAGNPLRPQIVFKLQQSADGGTTYNDVVFNTFNPANPAAGQELITGFTGSPSVYWVYSLTQDGIV
ncbi:MAG TPA: hypothetical protein VML50_16360, partial [Anaeromyxobacter sp.]|nr:hypothetical protein [Anaeromyxobacter sp.]